MELLVGAQAPGAAEDYAVPSAETGAALDAPKEMPERLSALISDNGNRGGSRNGSRGRRRGGGGRNGGNRSGNQGGSGRSFPRHASPQFSPQFDASRKMLAVASGSLVKQVAGSIAHTARSAEAPVISAVGPGSVNQAIKAIAIARSYLVNDGIDLAVEVMRGDPGGDIKDLIYLELKKVPRQETADDDDEFQDLKSAGRSGASQLAGAVANNVRESNKVRITAVGQNPVFRAVDSIAYARKYLKDDGFDLDFQPEFTQVTFATGTEGNAVRLTVLARQV